LADFEARHRKTNTTIIFAIEFLQGERPRQASENAIHRSVDQRPQNLEHLNNFPWNFQHANAVSANFEAGHRKTNMMIVSAIEFYQGERRSQASENVIHGSIDQRPQNLEHLNNFPWNFQHANAVSANYKARCPKTNTTTVSAIEFYPGE
jgi:hypothetical protein